MATTSLDTSLSTSSSLSSTASPKSKKVYRKILIITVIALEVLLLLAAIAFGVAAIATGIHLLWLGVIPCAIATIALFGGLLAVLKPPAKNVWAFDRLPPGQYPVIHTRSEPRKGHFRGSLDSFY